jgi:hypothetical protein
MLLLVLCACSAGLAVAFPEAPPTSACEHLRPGTRLGQTGLEGHVESPQNLVPTFGNTKIPPYHIQVHADTYSPGQTINGECTHVLIVHYVMRWVCSEHQR